jgi:stage V sporulation protein D (sporulation-specific penicillin-binding protein)
MHGRTFSRVGPRRAKILFYAVAIIALILAWRLIDVQVLKGPIYAKQALQQRSDTVDVFARRGSILDRDGNVMVYSLPSESIYAVPHDLANPAKTIAQLRRVLGKLSDSTLAQLQDRTLQFAWVARKIPHDQADAIAALQLPGVSVMEEDTGRRVDLVGQTASTLLGFVGIDENGLAGIEYTFDDLLKGSSGRVTVEADEFGHPIPFGRERAIKPAKPGMTLELTIDPYLQFVAESALKKQVNIFHAQSGTAIVMDPSTGEVLALADLPHFDPNIFWKFSPDARRERGVQDAYEPGSTFKLVTAAAALESGKVTTSSYFPARNSIEVGGRVIHNAEDDMPIRGSSETLEDIVAYSHNVGAAEVGLFIGGKPFYTMERRAGFGDPTHVGFAGENPGIVPAPAEWSDSSLATMAFGQGVSVTPLAMARYYCAIANGGLLMRPRILRAVFDSQGRMVYQYGPEVERRVFSRRTADTLRRFLRAVVVRGTGDPSGQVAGYTTAGKTGTAQVVNNGQYEPGAYIASFIGMVPYEHPRYLIFVKVERPQGAIYGSVVAAPAFAEIARQAMLHSGTLPATPRPKAMPKPKARLVRPEKTANLPL